MPAFRTQQDLLDYIEQLEQRVAKLETSAARIDRVTDRTAIVAANRSPGRIIFDSTADRLYAADNAANWNALW